MPLSQIILMFASVWIIAALQVTVFYNHPDLWWLAILAIVPLFAIAVLAPWNRAKPFPIVVGLLISFVIPHLYQLLF